MRRGSALALASLILMLACQDAPTGPNLPGQLQAGPPVSAVFAASDVVMTDLGTLGMYPNANDVNDLGTVVGSGFNESWQQRAWMWTEATGMVDLGTLGGTSAGAYGINNRGQVIGFATEASGATKAVMWTPTVNADGTVSPNIVDLGRGPGTFGLDINNQGDYIWRTASYPYNGYLYEAGTVTDFPGMLPRGMNDLGQVTFYVSVPGAVEARFWDGTSLITIPYMAGSTWQAGWDVNNLGVVAGQGVAGAYNRGFIWDGTTTVPLAAADGRHSIAQAINDLGFVGGTTTTGSNYWFPAVWDPDGSIVVLPTPADRYGGDVSGMSPSGSYVVGRAMQNGNTAMLWTLPFGQLTPEEQIANLADDVTALVTLGVLSGGQANALLSKLESALRLLDRGQVGAAVNVLRAFINQVTAYMGPIAGGAVVDGPRSITPMAARGTPNAHSAKLSPEQGQALIEAAQAAIDQLMEEQAG